MEKLGEYYGIKQSEMIAVGDGYNDLSMIEYAGLGVAMGNSVEEIKKRSDFVTLSNDEDGVAHVINKFVLNL
jgi:hydroxymethylpyrimidine pyrophosphatase-like HAD family hydrolase